MHWVLQENLYNEEGYKILVDTLDRFGITYDVVKVVPFSHELIPDINPTGFIMTCGSTTLTKIARSRGWIPGSFLNENHDFRKWKLNYGSHLLNADAEVSSFGKVALFWEEFLLGHAKIAKHSVV